MGFKTFMARAVSSKVPVWLASMASTPMPVTPSIRRTPEATEVSLRILKSPKRAVLSMWVPPQNSLEKPSSTETTRTTSPYFSPNRAMAPLCLASSMGISTMETGTALRISSLTSSSTWASSSGVRAEKWVKSKRTWRSLTSWPACSTWSPRTLRRAAWSRWAAVWLRIMARRRWPSTLAVTLSPRFRVPLSTTARCR